MSAHLWPVNSHHRLLLNLPNLSACYIQLAKLCDLVSCLVPDTAACSECGANSVIDTRGTVTKISKSRQWAETHAEPTGCDVHTNAELRLCSRIAVISEACRQASSGFPEHIMVNAWLMATEKPRCRLERTAYW